MGKRRAEAPCFFQKTKRTREGASTSGFSVPRDPHPGKLDATEREREKEEGTEENQGRGRPPATTKLGSGCPTRWRHTASSAREDGLGFLNLEHFHHCHHWRSNSTIDTLEEREWAEQNSDASSSTPARRAKLGATVLTEGFEFSIVAGRLEQIGVYSCGLGMTTASESKIEVFLALKAEPKSPSSESVAWNQSGCFSPPKLFVILKTFQPQIVMHVSFRLTEVVEVLMHVSSIEYTCMYSLTCSNEFRPRLRMLK